MLALPAAGGVTLGPVGPWTPAGRPVICAASRGAKPGRYMEGIQTFVSTVPWVIMVSPVAGCIWTYGLRPAGRTYWLSPCPRHWVGYSSIACCNRSSWRYSQGSRSLASNSLLSRLCLLVKSCIFPFLS